MSKGCTCTWVFPSILNVLFPKRTFLHAQTGAGRLKRDSDLVVELFFERQQGGVLMPRFCVDTCKFLALRLYGCRTTIRWEGTIAVGWGSNLVSLGLPSEVAGAPGQP